MPTPSILSLACVVPPYRLEQQSLAEKMAHCSGFDLLQSAKLKKMYANSAIEYRYTVLEQFTKESSEWLFRHDRPCSTFERNELYKLHAPSLALDAAKKAIEDHLITHLIYVSCTGIIAPGIQAQLLDALGLKPTVEQYGLNMMGCFGAFKALSLAKALSAQDSKARVLIICCELCSLHMQPDSNWEHQVGNALFADGAAACVIGQQDGLCTIDAAHSLQLPNSLEKMTWQVEDSGFVMGLAADVPSALEQSLSSFVATLQLPTECAWPVHPGGKNILQAVAMSLNLSQEKLASSWHVLKNYGNMSSPTFLFVLEHALKTTQEPCLVGLGFGPGLCVTSITLGRA